MGFARRRILPSQADVASEGIRDRQKEKGKVLNLTDWEETWELSSDLPQSIIVKFNKKRNREAERRYIDCEAQVER